MNHLPLKNSHSALLFSHQKTPSLGLKTSYSGLLPSETSGYYSGSETGSPVISIPSTPNSSENSPLPLSRTPTTSFPARQIESDTESKIHGLLKQHFPGLVDHLRSPSTSSNEEKPPREVMAEPSTTTVEEKGIKFSISTQTIASIIKEEN